MPTSLEDVLLDSGLPYRMGGEDTHVTTGWIGMECPWCGQASGKFHLGIHLSSGAANCWKCGPTSAAAVLYEYGLAKPIVDAVFQGFRRTKPPNLPGYKRSRLKIPDGVDKLRSPHVNYLQKRGFDPVQIVKLWDVQGFGPVGGQYTWRLFIPICLNGQIVSWTTRSTAHWGPRYLSAPAAQEAYSAKQTLYGIDYCRTATILVVEGPTDVWAIGPGAVAVCGISLSAAQTSLIARYARRIIVFDKSSDAQRRARQLADTVAVLPGETLTIKLDGEDPASADRQEIKELRTFAFGENR